MTSALIGACWDPETDKRRTFERALNLGPIQLNDSTDTSLIAAPLNREPPSICHFDNTVWSFPS